MRVAVLAREDLRQTLRDGGALFWMFIAPFLWVFFFGFMNRGSDPTKTAISLGVVRHDPSALAERLIEYLKAENFAVTVYGPGDALPQGSNGPARILTIPANFADAVSKRQKVGIELREVRRASAEGTFASEVALHKAIVRLLGGEILGGFDPAEDRVRVRAEWATGKKVPSGYYQTIPGNLVMFVLMAAMTNGAALLAVERKSGILRRLAATPLARAEILTGKLLGRAAVASIQAGVFVVIGLVLFRIDWGGSPAGLIAVLLSLVLCAASFGMLGGALLRSEDAASGASLVLVLAMSALGGCWWPGEIMPEWLQSVGHVFPTAWAMDGLNEIISWGGGLGDVVLPCGVLLLYGLAAGVVAARFLRVAA